MNLIASSWATDISIGQTTDHIIIMFFWSMQSVHKHFGFYLLFSIILIFNRKTWNFTVHNIVFSPLLHLFPHFCHNHFFFRSVSLVKHGTDTSRGLLVSFTWMASPNKNNYNNKTGRSMFMFRRISDFECSSRGRFG